MTDKPDEVLIMITKSCKQCKKNRLIRLDEDNCLWCDKGWPITRFEILEILTSITEEKIEKEWWNRFKVMDEHQDDEIYKKFNERQLRKAKEKLTRHDIDEIIPHMAPELESTVDDIFGPKPSTIPESDDETITIDRECKTHHFDDTQHCRACKLLALDFYVHGTPCNPHTHRIKAQQLA